ncbi:MAG: DUF4226 domain-containing protein [Mycobacterium sp.]|nr:DUF4226 domain-containing protein [Mycobacterium sp.]
MPDTLQDLRDVIDHVTTATGDRNAWRRGLSDAELAAVPTTVIDPAVATGLIAKIKSNHPALFDPRTGAPIVTQPPQPPTDTQQGDAATAMKKAEDDLAQQSSRAAQLDLHVIGAILNAHTRTVEGSDRLGRLQLDIENAVRSRTDLDTPAGARDFQRYLIGKIREIGAVVETANLDDTSKAALAGAWTALYASSGDTDTPPRTSEPPRAAAATPPASGPSTGPAAEPLPPYGSDLDIGPALDPLPPSEPSPISTAPPAAQQPPAPSAFPQSPMPTLPMSGAGMTPMSMPADPLSRGTTPPESAGQRYPGTGGMTLDELLDSYPLDEDPEADPESEDTDGQETPEPAADTAEPDTTVRLPDGSSVRAPSAAIAAVITAAVAGTPIAEAFHQQGISIPPPGTAVADPVAAARLTVGDIGMFTDRQALAVDDDRAFLDGRIRPVADVNGPSFLGWLHPPAPGATTPSAQPAPPPGETPPPTRPATAVENAR